MTEEMVLEALSQVPSRAATFARKRGLRDTEELESIANLSIANVAQRQHPNKTAFLARCYLACRYDWHKWMNLDREKFGASRGGPWQPAVYHSEAGDADPGSEFRELVETFIHSRLDSDERQFIRLRYLDCESIRTACRESNLTEHRQRLICPAFENYYLSQIA